MNFPKVTIGVILYKNLKYLKYSLGSLLNQDYPNIELLVRDQSPGGEAYEFIKSELPQLFDQLLIEKGVNKGHSGGHNELIRKSTGSYYLCASNDMWYPTHLTSSFVTELEKSENQKFGSATGKLMYWDFEKVDHEGIEKSFTNQIDSCGISLKSTHHFFDLGQGEADKGQYDHKRTIFGPSGALAIYRKNALESVKYQGASDEYFDELLHYKNDVDLAYRLQWANQKSLLLPEIKAYHHRQLSKQTRRKASKEARGNSFFGQQLVLLKNFDSKYSKKVRIKTQLRQWATLGYASLVEPSLIKQFSKLKANEKEIDLKIQSIERKTSAKEIEKLMS